MNTHNGSPLPDKFMSYHISSNQTGQWSLRKTGAKRSLRNYHSKQQAIKDGKALCRAKLATLFIHKWDGTVQTMHSYQ